MKKNLLLFIITGLLSTTIGLAQVIAYAPSDILMCSDNDFAIFDLTITEPEIIGGQDPSNLEIKFYITQADADTDSNPFANPVSVINSVNPQAIYARLQNISNGDFDTTSFDIIVIENPIINEPTPLETCDQDYDGFAEFNLQEKTDEISGGDPDLYITYHLTQLDAELATNQLATPYANSTPFFETLYVRGERISFGCYAITTLDLIVHLPPEVVAVTDFEEINDDGAGVTVFDLTSKIPEILNGQTDIDVTFYETQQDAYTANNVIITPTAYTNISNPQTIFARLENTEFCYAVTDFELVVVEGLIEDEPDDLYINEGDEDGMATFDLTVNEAQMLGDQDPLVTLFTYHITIEEATNGTNGIATPNAYQNILNPQTIFVRLTNSNTGFYVLTDFEIETDGILSITDNFINSLKVFPNPTTGIINLQSNHLTETATVKLYNLQGQIVLFDQKTPINGTISVDLSTMNTGVYFIKISSEEGAVVKKMVKL